jgi:polysaccharide biosynthesis/export protein
MKRHHNYIQMTIFICLLIFIISVSCSSMNSNVKDETAGKIVEQKTNKNETELEQSTDFILGSGDIIEIIVFRHNELKRSVKIDLSGKIMFPLIGDVVVVNKGIYELREELKERLSKYIVDPQVIISLTTVQSQKFIVLGEVSSPGNFMLDSRIKVSDAISKAGGYNQYADINTIFLIRRGKGAANLSVINFENILREGKFEQDQVLQNGDILYVPPKSIVNVSRFMQNLAGILSPIIGVESVIILAPQVKDAVNGIVSGGGTTIAVPIQ